MKFPELKTSRLNLTLLVDEDVNAIFELFSDNIVVKYHVVESFHDLSQAKDLLNDFQSRFNERIGIRWGIRLKDSERLIGTCGFTWNRKMKSAVIGFDLIPSYWGKGIMTEAVHRIVQAAFLSELPCGELNRIQGETVLGNAASDALMLKVGFKEEGVRRESGYWKNKFHDLKCFGLIRSEYSEI